MRDTFLAEGVPEAKLLQVPFGADVERFRPAREREDRLFRVLFVGQVGLGKGVPYLLQAWQRLGWRDAELWLAGRIVPALRPILQRYQNLVGVRFWGHVEDPVALYQGVDVFAFPTLSEGSALVTYEALACGLPVVTTPNAGSVVRDGVEGFLVPIRDVEALAVALERLRSDARLRREMGRAARARAEEFPWGGYGNRLTQEYRRFL